MKGNKVLSLATEASRVGLQTGFEAVHNSKGLGKDHHNHKLIYGPPFPPTHWHGCKKCRRV